MRNSPQLIDTDALPGKFAPFEHFLRYEDMVATAELLEAAEMPVRRVGEQQSGQWREKVIMGQPLQPKYWLEIPTDQFARARYLIREAAEAVWVGEALEQHPFNDYATPELEDILRREDYYGQEAAVIARNILLGRGEEVELAELREDYRAHIEQRFTPAPVSKLSIGLTAVVGVAAGLILQLLFWLASLGILLYIFQGKQRDPDGRSHFAYDIATRRAGKIAVGLVVGALVFGLANYFLLHIYGLMGINPWLWWWR